MTSKEAYDWMLNPPLCKCDGQGYSCKCGRRNINSKILSEIEEIIAKDGNYVSDTIWEKIWNYPDRIKQTNKLIEALKNKAK